MNLKSGKVSYHKRSNGEVWQSGRVEVEHCRVGVFGDFAEDKVARLRPEIQLPVFVDKLFIEAFYLHPLDHQPFECNHGLQDSSQSDL